MNDNKISQKLILSSKVYDEAKKYWLGYLDKNIKKSNFPTDCQPSTDQDYSNSELVTFLSEELSKNIISIANQSELGIFLILMTGVTFLLSKYLDEDEVVIGTPLFKVKSDLKQVNSMIPIKIQVHREESFKDLLLKSKKIVSESIKHQHYPMSELAKHLQLDTDDFLTQIKTVVSFEPLHPITEQWNADTLFHFSIQENRIKLTISYNDKLYQLESISRLLHHLISYYEQVLKNPNESLVNVELLSEVEKEQILFQFNDTNASYPLNRTVHQLFEEQVREKPDKIAVRFGHIQLTYRELNERANQVAQYLRSEHQVRPDTLVGLFMERSHFMLISMLGVLKAGAAYVPIDPDFPEQRVKSILDDAQIQVVLTMKSHLRLIHRLQWECPAFRTFLCLDTDDVYVEEEIPHHGLMDEQLWDFIGSKATNEIEGGGWISSYTGQSFSSDEMDEYAENIYRKLQPYLKSTTKVLEIGCSSGITLLKIAPEVGHYHGIDLSKSIIEKTKQRVAEKELKNVSLECLSAHELEKIQDKDFDLIIINSVIQYFPSHNYLRDVLNKSISLLKDEGVIFLGDIMDLDLKSEFIQSLYEFKTKHSQDYVRTKTDFSAELFLSRRFIEDLAFEYPQIKQVQVSDKWYTLENELSLYRFDACLEINRKQTSTPNGYKHKVQHGLNILKQYPTTLVETDVQPHHLAYAIYTSGSTGNPKGVMLQHRNVCNFIYAMKDQFNSSDYKKILALTNISFDIFVLETLFPLAQGWTVVIADQTKQLDPQYLNQVIVENKVDILQATPSRIQLLLSGGIELPCLQVLSTILIGGEALSLSVLNQLRNKTHAKIYNMYGPTETTVWSTIKDVTDAEKITIGQPIANTQIYIMDRYQQLQPIGVPGELCIGGEGVARGYLNKPELTAEKFVSNPWVSEGRIYRTGDLARQLPNGEIEFIGRKDHQIKVRGYRVELEEIELCLRQHDLIHNAVVIAKQNENDQTTLCAFYVATDKLKIMDLREFLASKLPDYMIPSAFIQLEHIPLTPNGKVDRNALQKRNTSIRSEVEYVAPRSDKEAMIAKVWADVLKVDRVGIHDNFFALGGDSLKAIQVVSKIASNMYITINDLFENQTIALLSQKVSSQSEKVTQYLEEMRQFAKTIRVGDHHDRLMEQLAQYRERNKRLAQIDLSIKEEYQHIFLTGVTGFLGAHLLFELLQQTNSQIYVLIRAQTEEEARRRLQQKTIYYFGEDFFETHHDRIVVVKGDLTLENLGLSPKYLESLSHTIDCVIHAAAIVSHFGEFTKFYQTNVQGTKKIIEFAKMNKRKDIHYISTTSVGSNTGLSLFTEYNVGMQGTVDNYYIETKLTAENLVIQAREEGLRSNVYRVGNLCSNERTGIFQENADDNAIGRLIRSLIQLGMIPDLGEKVNDFSSVDLTAKAIVLLFNKKNIQNELFHVYNTHLVGWSEIGRAIQHVGYPVELKSIDEFIDQILQYYHEGKYEDEITTILIHSYLLRVDPISFIIKVNEMTSQLLERLGFTWSENLEQQVKDFIGSTSSSYTNPQFV